MIKGDKIGIVACSNGIDISKKEEIKELEQQIIEMGLVPVFSECIFAKDSVFSGTANERAKCLMDFYKREDIKAIFDISGGDLANEILPYLDFDEIARTEKMFWGYSDLTTIINAIYTKTGNVSGLYQIRNFIYNDGKRQKKMFEDEMMGSGNSLSDIEWELIQGDELSGILVGGNIRCLLKLAGTEYWPDMNEKILLLEAFGGRVPQMVTYLNQLKQLGVFEKISGILLGTFTTMEKDECKPTITELVKKYAGSEIPIAKTNEIGHGTNSKMLYIGKHIFLKI